MLLPLAAMGYLHVLPIPLERLESIKMIIDTFITKVNRLSTINRKALMG